MKRLSWRISLGFLIIALILPARIYVDRANACDARDPRCIPTPQHRQGRAPQWQQRGYSGGGGGGGRTNYGAAAALGLGILGAAINAAQSEQNVQRRDEQAAANADRARRIAARNAYCSEVWRQANRLNEQGNQLWDRGWDPGGAIPFYEQAIGLLSRCDETKNASIVRGNLDKARREYAAFRPDDDRVNTAQSNYADQNIYRAPNPFGSPKTISGASASQDHKPGSCPQTYPFDCNCEPAGGGASWAAECLVDNHPRIPNVFKHPITPQILFSKAKELCVAAPLEEQRRCITDAKVQIIMREDSTIRDDCSGRTGDALIQCVDTRYIYGPRGAPALRAQLSDALAARNFLEERVRAKIDILLAERDRLTEARADATRVNRQIESLDNYLLGVETDTPPDLAAADSERADYVQPAVEQRLERVARTSVEVALSDGGWQLSPAEQHTCGLVAYQTVRGALSGGGTSPVPDQCRPIVYTAVSQLAFQAAAQVDTRAPPEEDPLQAYLLYRNAHSGGANDGDLGKPQADLQGLTPDTEMQREGREILERLRRQSEGLPPG